MCGFVGFLGGRAVNGTAGDRALLQRMSDAITHRGPDSAGYWSDADQRIGLGHRRLSIVDLSPAGHQPMQSGSGRYVIAFNGEIYNHRALRRELEFSSSLQPSPVSRRDSDSPPTHIREGAYAGSEEVSRWQGHSDTEVMLAAFERWGVEAALTRFNGMFAFALWDRRERMLLLARDRFGEKPLYYGWMGDAFLFGSELKALKVHPAWCSEMDLDAVALYMRHNYIPAPYSIYRGIRKLSPAHVLSISLANGKREMPQPRAYWSVKAAAEAGIRRPFSGNETEALESLDVLLRDAVASRMEADVPVGAFLSGGVDSSTVVALMQAQASRPVRTFSIGFLEPGYNEAEHAKAVAKHLGTDHTELYVTPEETMAVIPRLPQIYDEPFADSSQIPTVLISRMTRQHVTVALSGDAGDELFGGYNRYFWGRSIWDKIGPMPKSVRVAMAHGLTALSPQGWDRIYSVMKAVLPLKMRASLPGDKIHKLAGILACASPEEMYRRLISHWTPESVVVGASDPPTALTDHALWAGIPDFTQRMMYLDQVTYLPDDILTKVDRASMAVSLEARVPFLDHRVAEFAWALPLSMKIRGNQGKWLLRQVLNKYIPRELTERPKMGFGVPIGEWLRGPLREWGEGLLGESRLRREGVFDSVAVRSKWNEHLSGRRNWAYLLWDVLMFQAWLEESRAQ